MPKLTPELLRVFIRRIEVYETFVKYSRSKRNTCHRSPRTPHRQNCLKAVTGRQKRLPVTYAPHFSVKNITDM